MFSEIPKLKIHIVLILIIVFLPAQRLVANGWSVEIEDLDNGIVVYSRTIETGEVEFKAVTHIKSPLSAFVALIRDVDAMPEWVDRTVDAKVLRWVSDTEVIAYNITEMPLFIKDRDAIIHTVLKQDTKTGVVTISADGLQQYDDGNLLYNYRKNENKYIRMAKVVSTWTFEPESDGTVKVIFKGYGDPGGELSGPVFRWLIGLSVTESPYKTLKSMKKIIKREKYQSARFDFIKDVGKKDD